jgi:hypothetical protein
MILAILSAVLESVYYNGKPKSSKKLEREDFTQLAIAATGSFMRSVYRDEEGYASIYAYFGNCMTERQYPVTEDDNHRSIVQFDCPVVKLPHSLGVFSVKPIDNENYIKDDVAFTRLNAGGDYLYDDGVLDDLGDQTFTLRGKTLFLKNLFEETKKVAVEGLFIDDNFDIPEDVAFQVMNYIFTKLIPTEGFPIDKTDDQNPNLIEYKKRLQGSEQL